MMPKAALTTVSRSSAAGLRWPQGTIGLFDGGRGKRVGPSVTLTCTCGTGAGRTSAGVPVGGETVGVMGVAVKGAIVAAGRTGGGATTGANDGSNWGLQPIKKKSTSKISRRIRREKCRINPALLQPSNRSVLAAMMKSLRCRPLILWVHHWMVTRPHSVMISG